LIATESTKVNKKFIEEFLKMSTQLQEIYILESVADPIELVFFTNEEFLLFLLLNLVILQ